MTAPNPNPPLSPAEIRARVTFDDARLLAECELHIHRTGGPGGQHRNKVETAIRLIHRPTGVTVSAGETRSQHENKARALARLREALAVEFRVSPPERIEWPETARPRDGRLRVSEHNAGLAEALALVLDAFAAAGGSPSAAAERLGISSSSLTKFLADHPRAWVEANRIRAAVGAGPLRNPRS